MVDVVFDWLIDNMGMVLLYLLSDEIVEKFLLIIIMWLEINRFL